jgi:PhnB protein
MSPQAPLSQFRRTKVCTIAYRKDHGHVGRTQRLSVLPRKHREAIAFYQEVFGGQVTVTRLGDVDPGAASGQKNLVVNALLTGGDVTLRASDRQDASPDPQTRIELSLIGTDDARLRALFDALADGGTVRTTLERQFWGDVFGAVTDKYGIGWQVNIGTAGA